MPIRPEEIRELARCELLRREDINLIIAKSAAEAHRVIHDDEINFIQALIRRVLEMGKILDPAYYWRHPKQAREQVRESFHCGVDLTSADLRMTQRRKPRRRSQ